MTTARHGYSNSQYIEGSEVERRHIAVYFLFLVLPFCGKAPERNLPDPKAVEAVFHENARKHGWDSYPTTLEVKYEIIEDFHVVDKCDFSDNTVRLNAQEWERATEIEREIIIFHVLGHCLLMRNHRVECSLMNKNYITKYEYKEYREQYIAELFSMRGSKVINEEAYTCPIVTE